jgi:hypothetical protein
MHIRHYCGAIRAFAVRFLDARQGLAQAASLGDHFSHYVFLGRFTAEYGLLRLLQLLAAADFL